MAWRKVPYTWDDQCRNGMEEELANWTPLDGLDVDCVNILLIGQVGNGKSSFINTINSVFRGYVNPKAVTGNADHSLTTKFRKYKIHRGRREKLLKFRICDSMGLEDGQDSDCLGYNMILEGNIPDHFQFNPRASVTMDMGGITTQPCINDKTHVMVLIIDATNVEVMPQNLVSQMKAMKEQANSKGVPVLVIMTKIDKLGTDISNNLESIYTNELVSDAVKKIADKLQVQPSQVMPVKNYNDEIELDTTVDILALAALRQILRLVDSYCEDQMDRLEAKASKKVDSQKENNL